MLKGTKFISAKEAPLDLYQLKERIRALEGNGARQEEYETTIRPVRGDIYEDVVAGERR